jgi:signal transduction histidine kinase
LAEHNLEDFLDEMVTEHGALASAMGIDLDQEADPWLSAYFDEDLVRGVLHNAIGNAQRYTRNRLRLSAAQEEDYAVIRVEDDGPGFPAAMLELQSVTEPAEGFGRERTQLGLHFSNLVARLHRNGERCGRVELDNQSNLGGGRFSLWLP